jgi:integrase
VIAFRRWLDEVTSAREGKPLSKATSLQILNAIRAFMLWLADQSGYRSRIRYSDAAYFRLSEKDARIAKASTARPIPTPEQIECVLRAMPASTDIERSNRAVIAFTWLTGVRDGALASLKVKHVDLTEGRVNPDPREVKTKNRRRRRRLSSLSLATLSGLSIEWIEFLTSDRLWGLDDPLFPATLIEHGHDRQFRSAGLARRHWSNADAIRALFKDAFEAVGLPGFNPHSFRHALAMLGERSCSTPEEFKAWSQNLGHEQVLTTLTSYGEVAPYRQAEIMRTLGARPAGTTDRKELARRFMELAVAAGLSESDRTL